MKARHPQLLYESKLYKVLQGGLGIPHIRYLLTFGVLYLELLQIYSLCFGGVYCGPLAKWLESENLAGCFLSGNVKLVDAQVCHGTALKPYMVFDLDCCAPVPATESGWLFN